MFTYGHDGHRKLGFAILPGMIFVAATDVEVVDVLLTGLPLLLGTILGGTIASFTAFVTARANHQRVVELEKSRYTRDYQRHKNEQIRSAAGKFIEVALDATAEPLHETGYATAGGAEADLLKAIAEVEALGLPSDDEKVKDLVRLRLAAIAAKTDAEKQVWVARSAKRREMQAAFTQLELIGPSDAITSAATKLLSTSGTLLIQLKRDPKLKYLADAQTAAWIALLQELQELD